MRITLVGILLAGLLVGWPAEGWGGLESGGDRAAWSLSLAAGYDTYIHTFPLATEDTTETVSELTAVLGLEGRSPVRRVHRWQVRPELSVGTELLRGRLDFDYRLQPDSLTTALRLGGSVQARKYHGGTSYTLSSDAIEGRTTARWYLSPRGKTAGEVRLFASLLDYRTPSTLEIDHHETGGLLFWRSGRDARRHFALGGRLLRRSYPDSAAIDRVVAAAEAEYDAAGLSGDGFRFFQRSERRSIRDQEAKPSAWAHWTELQWEQPAGRYRLLTELESEVWRYDRERSAYVDSWRVGGSFAVAGGGLLAPNWRFGPTFERFAAGDSPESYTQAGLKVGVESFLTAVSGSLTLEFGHRDYDRESAPAAANNGSADLVDEVGYYSDFFYWEVWLMATWGLNDDLGCDILANYQPENHAEKTEDSAVTFVSVRFTWRP